MNNMMVLQAEDDRQKTFLNMNRSPHHSMMSGWKTLLHCFLSNKTKYIKISKQNGKLMKLEQNRNGITLDGHSWQQPPPPFTETRLGRHHGTGDEFRGGLHEEEPVAVADPGRFGAHGSKRPGIKNWSNKKTRRQKKLKTLVLKLIYIYIYKDASKPFLLHFAACLSKI